MTEVIPGWILIVATGAGMLVSVLAAWAAVKAQIIQPLLASIIEEVISAMKPDRERWDNAEAEAAAAKVVASSAAEQITYIRKVVDEIKDEVSGQDVEVHELRELQRRHMEVGNERHEKIDKALANIEGHLEAQDRYHARD